MISSKLSVNLNKTKDLLFDPNYFNNPNSNINIDSNIISLNDSGKIWGYFPVC